MVFMIVLVVILFMMALQDIRTQEVRGRTLVFYSVTGIVTAGIRFFGYGCTLAGADALLLGILLLILHRISKNGVGTADFWILAGLPLFLDADTMWMGIAASMPLLLLTALCTYWEERDRYTGIPYIPFLTAGVFIEIWRRIGDDFF